MIYQMSVYSCFSHHCSCPQEWLMPCWVSSCNSPRLRGLAESFQTKGNFLCFRLQPLSSFAAESRACPGAEKSTNHVPIWQINLAVIMTVIDRISYAQGCPWEKDCLSRWLLRPESPMHTSPRQIGSSQEWIHCTRWRVISPDKIHKVSQLI